MNLEEMYPLPGFAFIGMTTDYSETEQGIYIPEGSRRVKSCMGVVAAYTPYRLQSYYIWDHGKRRLCRPWRDNENFKGILGKTVVTNGAGVNVTGALFSVPLECIVAVDPMNECTAAPENEVERCRWCQSAGEHNLLLDDYGYCLQCGRNRDGKLAIYHEDSMDSDLAYFLSNKKMIDELEERAGLGKGQIISFAGQKKRSSS